MNWFWTVCEIFDPSMTLSTGSSDVNTSSTLEQSTALLTLGLNGGWICFARSFFQSTILGEGGWVLAHKIGWQYDKGREGKGTGKGTYCS